MGLRVRENMKRIGKFSQSQTLTKKLCFADVKQGFFCVKILW